ncbi:LytTR family two component transcriptional regulator /response regulator receiver protein [Desulfitobacterium sp. LBE]|uniref:Stage 0 sporulation protein A homolog n=4 Tax=root TaxID=1 RepID=Q24SG2_DESHY|nr:MULTISPECIES: LytTR family transcriptional regulator DNA-binding domain-containing protein [Desulfitobacterium]ACL22413.1 two component transcriptional regulator, LytTR family [Desulfitobacterium hafniense DCB-2]KTE92235.1 LytTR family transcriptional regulator [Desulfitobacterium hafniense]MEA5023960.1 LytTR family transcriptional regulator DNA-binding domain-containing protein [Desulfitobacterium hafniense]TWH59803.1 LytTR family two component transcriptional regulator /response regulator 
MKLRALLVDDESPARKELRYLLQDYTDLQVIGEAANAIEALELINNLEYSVVFLDIDMPGLKGIDLARQLKEKESSPAIIFITAHEEFAVDAFCVNALDYLLKPINPKRLDQAIKKLFIQHGAGTPPASPSLSEPDEPTTATDTPLPKQPPENSTIRPLEVIPVEQRGKTILLRPEEIVYIYTDKDNVFAKTQKESYLTRFTLRELEARLNPNLFFRTHRCYLVNIKRMRELIPYFNGTYSIVVDDHERSEVPVSRTQSRKLKEILGL